MQAGAKTGSGSLPNDAAVCADTFCCHSMTQVRADRAQTWIMARHPRLDLPHIPQHVVQRGNNRLPCFLDDSDRLRYLQLLRESLSHTGCHLHAYVLMDNHVHLLITPPATGMIARFMQKLGRQYVSQFNARHHRTGTLWEGRYRSCLVATAVTCCTATDISTSTPPVPA